MCRRGALPPPGPGYRVFSIHSCGYRARRAEKRGENKSSGGSPRCAVAPANRSPAPDRAAGQRISQRQTKASRVGAHAYVHVAKTRSTRSGPKKRRQSGRHSRPAAKTQSGRARGSGEGAPMDWIGERAASVHVHTQTHTNTHVNTPTSERSAHRQSLLAGTVVGLAQSRPVVSHLIHPSREEPAAMHATSSPPDRVTPVLDSV